MRSRKRKVGRKSRDEGGVKQTWRKEGKKEQERGRKERQKEG